MFGMRIARFLLKQVRRDARKRRRETCAVGIAYVGWIHSMVVVAMLAVRAMVGVPAVASRTMRRHDGEILGVCGGGVRGVWGGGVGSL